MPTSSIFTNIRITTREDAKRFLDALEASEKVPPREIPDYIKPPLTDKEKIRELIAKRKK